MLKMFHLPLIALMLLCCAETVPPLSMLGKWHKVKRGDTVESVSRKYGVSAEEIAELNQIPFTGRIVGRGQIFIPLGAGSPPGDGKPERISRKADVLASETRTSVTQTPVESRPSTSTFDAMGQCKKEGRPCFLWPVDGEVIQWFGKDDDSSAGASSDGIDIKAPAGTSVNAAENGEVLYSGDAIKGYGNLILVRHEDNIITVYAHNNRNLVKEGTKVIRGEKIAEVGNSGAASQAGLHFEVRVNEQPVNPMLYLPTKE